jgi:hypothetical protein
MASGRSASPLPAKAFKIKTVRPNECWMAQKRRKPRQDLLRQERQPGKVDAEARSRDDVVGRDA